MAQPQPIVRVPIVTLRYAGAPPYPHPQVLDPTPDEEYQRVEQARQASIAQKDQEARERDAKPSGGGFMGKLGKIAGSVATAVEKTSIEAHSKGEAQLRQMEHQRNLERFTINFPELVNAGDSLITDYSCKVMHQGMQISGNLQITTRHVLFLSTGLKEIIPLNEVASIQLSVALETLDNGPPFIMTIPAPNVLADCLQLFTVRQQLFQFLSFQSTTGSAGSLITTSIKGRTIDRAYNFLDHAWRGAVQVPLPGVQYAQ
jgi:hypothetical protein